MFVRSLSLSYVSVWEALFLKRRCRPTHLKGLMEDNGKRRLSSASVTLRKLWHYDHVITAQQCQTMMSPKLKRSHWKTSKKRNQWRLRRDWGGTKPEPTRGGKTGLLRKAGTPIRRTHWKSSNSRTIRTWPGMWVSICHAWVQVQAWIRAGFLAELSAVWK